MRQTAVLVASYAALTLVMTWPYVNYADFASASYGGDARLIIWTLAWDNHALLSGLPLFQSNLFFPAAESLQYNEHLFGVSLFTLPWAAAGASPVLAYNATSWLAFFLNGITAFALLRRFVPNPFPVFVGSLAYACSFYVMLHAHGHLHLIWIWPLPLSMLLLDQWFDDPRVWRLVPWFATVLIGALTSWYVAVMVLLVNGLMTLILLLVQRDQPGRERPAVMHHVESARPGRDPAAAALRGGWRRLGYLACAVVALGVCLAPLARHYVGLRSAPGEAAAFSASLASYLVPPENTIVGRWWMTHMDARPGSIWGEQTLFAGWIALALAAVGLGVLMRGRHVSQRAWVFPALAVGGFLLSLGPSPSLLGGSTLAPFSWLAALPGFEGMRSPARFAAVVMLGVAGLAAIGGAAVTRAFLSRKPAALLALVPLMLMEWFVVGFPAGKPVPYPVPAIYQTPQVRSARSLVSLPEYANTPEWVLGADYLYYSTVHWRPIVNGFGRAQPANYADVLTRVRNFPSSADDLRALGVQYVVLHADRFPDGARDMLAAAQASVSCRLVLQIGSDYLFEILGT